MNLLSKINHKCKITKLKKMILENKFQISKKLFKALTSSGQNLRILKRKTKPIFKFKNSRIKRKVFKLPIIQFKKLQQMMKLILLSNNFKFRQIWFKVIKKNQGRSMRNYKYTRKSCKNTTKKKMDIKLTFLNSSKLFKDSNKCRDCKIPLRFQLPTLDLEFNKLKTTLQWNQTHLFMIQLQVQLVLISPLKSNSTS